MIKNWLQFINEGKIPLKDSGDVSFWSLSEEDIKDIMIDFEHNNYIVNIEFGFLERVSYFDPEEGSSIKDGNNKVKDIFTEDVNIGYDIQPSYFIRIQWNNKTTKDDITDSLHFICDTIKDRANAEITLCDQNGNFNIDSIKIQQGAYTIEESPDDELELEEYLALFVKEKKSMNISSKFVADYYGWESDEEKGENVYLHIDVEDLADELLERDNNYKKYLVNGIDDSNYWSSDYQPDTNTLFTYSLDSQNKTLLIKCLIKEFGGIDNLVKEADISNMEEHELINFLLNERFKKSLDILCKDSEIVKEVKQICGDFEMQAHVDANQEDLWKEFISIVDEVIEDYTIIEKEVKKHYTTKEGEKKEYTETNKFFSIPLNNDWIKEMDSDMRFRMGDILDVFKEWSGEMSFNYKLDPNWSDYGDADNVEINKEVKWTLENYLKD